MYNILNNYKHQEKIGNLFFVYFCRLQLKSFSEFIVFCNITWQYFKYIIINYYYYYLVFCMVYYWSSVTLVGVLTPIHWE